MSLLDTLLDFDAALEWQDDDDPLLDDVASSGEPLTATAPCAASDHRLIA